jgi:hypothetical protein
MLEPPKQGPGEAGVARRQEEAGQESILFLSRAGGHAVYLFYDMNDNLIMILASCLYQSCSVKSPL